MGKKRNNISLISPDGTEFVSEDEMREAGFDPNSCYHQSNKPGKRKTAVRSTARKGANRGSAEDGDLEWHYSSSSFVSPDGTEFPTDSEAWEYTQENQQ